MHEIPETYPDAISFLLRLYIFADDFRLVSLSALSQQQLMSTVPLPDARHVPLSISFNGKCMEGGTVAVMNVTDEETEAHRSPGAF